MGKIDLERELQRIEQEAAQKRQDLLAQAIDPLKEEIANLRQQAKEIDKLIKDKERQLVELTGKPLRRRLTTEVKRKRRSDEEIEAERRQLESDGRKMVALLKKQPNTWIGGMTLGEGLPSSAGKALGKYIETGEVEKRGERRASEYRWVGK